MVRPPLLRFNRERERIERSLALAHRLAELPGAIGAHARASIVKDTKRLPYFNQCASVLAPPKTSPATAVTTLKRIAGFALLLGALQMVIITIIAEVFPVAPVAHLQSLSVLFTPGSSANSVLSIFLRNLSIYSLLFAVAALGQLALRSVRGSRWFMSIALSKYLLTTVLTFSYTVAAIASTAHKSVVNVMLAVPHGWLEFTALGLPLALTLVGCSGKYREHVKRCLLPVFFLGCVVLFVAATIESQVSTHLLVRAAGLA